jgi:hypothetical protein
MAYKGRFSPKNPKKYKGDPTNIIFRSLWERKVMNYLDENPNILEWSSEEIVIPYLSPVDGKYHRYFPDFLVKARKSDGKIYTMLLEVKPKHQTSEPKVQSRKTRKYITEVMTWGINKAKWEYANEYCLDRGWEFKLITEEDLFNRTRK